MTFVNTLIRTDEFADWLAQLRDAKGKARIVARLESAALGNFGDCEPVGEGVSEMRIHTGPGYRVYYTRRGLVVYVLLLGGDKSTQKRDIKRAVQMARQLEEWAMSKAKARSRPKALKLATFDASEFLDNEAVITEYLAVALADPNPDMFLRAVANVAKARGVAEVAKASGLGRESLYKALAPGAKVRYETVRKVLDSLGVKLTIAA